MHYLAALLNKTRLYSKSSMWGIRVNLNNCSAVDCSTLFVGNKVHLGSKLRLFERIKLISWWLAYLSRLETSGHLADVKIRESGLANYFFHQMNLLFMISLPCSKWKLPMNQFTESFNYVNSHFSFLQHFVWNYSNSISNSLVFVSRRLEYLKADLQ